MKLLSEDGVLSYLNFVMVSTQTKTMAVDLLQP